jgi:hypothetical protein
MKKLLSVAVLSMFVLCLASGTVFSQRVKSKESLSCRDNWYNGKLSGHCELKEQTLPATNGTIDVDGRKNGGITIRGWERNEILVRARIQAAAPSEAEAVALVRQVNVETAGAKILATGPERTNDSWWSVSYEIFVPHRSNLSLKTTNGGISISDVTGQIEFTAHNGGVNLDGVGGAVRGSTTNGGLNVELSGARWEGEALDVRTTNGGVSMSIPEDYSAHLETSTVNGGLHVDFPVTVQGKVNKQLAVNLGSGGATVRATTTNGGVSIRRKGAGLQL